MQPHGVDFLGAAATLAQENADDTRARQGYVEL
jgi:hypothetical protein